MKTILLSAGGTGGHVLPAILVARKIKERSPNQRIIILGVGTSIEKKLLASTDFEYVVLKSKGVVGSNILAKLNSISSHLLNFKAVKKILRENSVASVLGFGGYPSFMPLLVARILGLKTNLFEQNGKAGLANKIASLFVDKVFSVPYAEGLMSSNVIPIFNPVREEIRSLKNIEPAVSQDSKCKILVVGGSQGAVGMNTLVVEVLKSLSSSNFLITHQTGEADFERVRSAYQDIKGEVRVSPFLDDMAQAYQDADLVISRAGAGTYGEILAIEKPCIFIPLPISRGHQYYNVKHLVESGGAFVVDQAEGEMAVTKLKNVVSSLEGLAPRKEVVSKLIKFKNGVAGGAGEDVLSKVLLEDLI